MPSSIETRSPRSPKKRGKNANAALNANPVLLPYATEPPSPIWTEPPSPVQPTPGSCCDAPPVDPRAPGGRSSLLFSEMTYLPRPPSSPASEPRPPNGTQKRGLEPKWKDYPPQLMSPETQPAMQPAPVEPGGSARGPSQRGGGAEAALPELAPGGDWSTAASRQVSILMLPGDLGV